MIAHTSLRCIAFHSQFGKTNLIESFNKQTKKCTKRKEQFPHEEALEKFLVSQFESYNQ
ncbi:transposase [Paenibacillus sp. MER 180]|uniref:transposase n=1 Tax=Paenibacillus sp. MER 180 TaxID=2939570 RepID=UPI0037C54E70